MMAHIFFWNYSGIMYGGFYGIPFLVLTEIVTIPFLVLTEIVTQIVYERRYSQVWTYS